MAEPQRTLCSETLSLIRAAKDLLHEEKSILASDEDCSYFRSLYRSSREAVSIRKPAALTLQPSIDEPTSRPLSQTALIPPPFQPPEPAPVKNSPALLPDPVPIEPALFEQPPVREPFGRDAGFAEIQKILSKIAPQLAYLPNIPSDEKARQIAEQWKTRNQSAPISLLFFHELPSQQKFLTNLAIALDTTFGSARLISAEGIEKDKQWEPFLSVAELKLVIICDYALWQLPSLLQYYREIPNQTDRFLLNKPLMLLPDLTLYLKDPQLKRSLWKALCQKIRSL
jgi:hypothetical protein